MNSILRIFLGLASSALACHAAPVTGWVRTNGDLGFDAGSEATNSPVTTDADMDTIVGSFPAVSLEVGDGLQLTGQFIIEGPGALTGGQIRFGLFKAPAGGPITGDGSGYVGTWCNDPLGSLLTTTDGSTGNPFSGTAAINQLNVPAGSSLQGETTYDFSYTIFRIDDENLQLDFSISDGDAFAWEASGAVTTAGTGTTFTYDTAAFLLGGTLDRTGATYTDIEVNSVELPPPAPFLGHYWDFELDTNIFPYLAEDLVSELDLEEVGFTTVGLDPEYGEAFPGANQSLISSRDAFEYFEGDTFEAGRASSLNFGPDDFAISYWVYDDGSDNDPGGLDENLRGARVLDCNESGHGGVEILVNANGYFSLRVDDVDGNESVSVLQAGTPFETLAFPTDAWVHVAINVDRGNNLITVFFDGISQGTYDISNLTGEVACSQDLQVGVINGGEDGGSQASALDELAFYPGLLSPADAAALTGATTTPADIIAALVSSPGTFRLSSVTFDSATGTAQISFPTSLGLTYTVEGSDDLQSWVPVGGTDTNPIDGTDGIVSFDHVSGQTVFYYRVIQN